MKNRYIVFLILSLSLSSVMAKGNFIDSLLARTTFGSTWYLMPQVSYSPETSLGLGAAGGFYFPTGDKRRVSNVTFGVIYTLRNQVNAYVAPKFYVGQDKRTYLNSSVSYRYYPYTYYTPGNSDDGFRLSYVMNQFKVDFQPHHEFPNNWIAGCQVLFCYTENKVSAAKSAVLDSVLIVDGAVGWGKHFQAAIGLQGAYDSRDNRFWTSKGVFVKTTLTQHLGSISKYSYGKATFDYRHYFPTWRGQVICWQVYGDASWGDVPFYDRCTLGGEDRLRGIKRNLFTGDFSWTAQLEYRIPLFWRLKLHVFVAAGDVYDYGNVKTDKVKFSYGAGLRARLNDSQMHLRVDVAKGNYNRVPEFYLTVSEAF